MLKMLLKKIVKKHGLIGLLLKIGDIAVKITPSKADDRKWAKAKDFIKSL